MSSVTGSQGPSGPPGYLSSTVPAVHILHILPVGLSSSQEVFPTLPLFVGVVFPLCALNMRFGVGFEF